MTRKLIPPGAPEFRALFGTFQHSVFRLETLQSYGMSDGEDETIAAFLAGNPEPPDPRHDAWAEQIAANVQAGKAVQRVHVVQEPLSDYLRYELTWGYAPNVRAGEDVRVIPVPAGGQWPTGIPQRDFWLFDSSERYDMHYDQYGTWLGVEHVTAPAAVTQAHDWRSTALHRSVPWSTYLSAHPELARHLTLARSP